MGQVTEPFHEGEMALQRAAGNEEAARRTATVIADAVLPGARPFLQALPMLVVASRDVRGYPWASVIWGEPGFVSADEDEGRCLTLDRLRILTSDGDGLWRNVAVGSSLGVLAIELSTRRRLRVNGRVERLTDKQLMLRVAESYPNCAKYIQRRHMLSVMPRHATERMVCSEGLLPDDALLAAVRVADTAFVASGHPSRGLDVSHRGGKRGFIEVLSQDTLRVPDYAGNGMFNTLGNLLVDARCGLSIMDFEHGRVFQMAGDANLQFQTAQGSCDALSMQRAWDFRINAWRSFEIPVSAVWDSPEFSPANPL